jgi:hypothetical protein
MIREQRQVLLVATALSVFWVLTIVVAAVSRGDSAHFAFVVATLIFSFHAAVTSVRLHQPVVCLRGDPCGNRAADRYRRRVSLDSGLN